MLADYYARTAVAASQALAGFDGDRIRECLEKESIGVVIGSDAAKTSEGRMITDLAVRLLARMYPMLVVRTEGTSTATADDAMALARRINPRIEFSATPTVELAIGTALSKPRKAKRIFVGSKGWAALVGTREPLQTGRSNNPFGPGAAACLGAANLFRFVFRKGDASLDKEAIFNTLASMPEKKGLRSPSGDLGEVVLVGAGAIGNGTAWALSRVNMSGVLHVVDHETIELGNLQRYVLAERTEENLPKVDVLGQHFRSGVIVQRHRCRFDEFIAACGSKWDKMLLALDSARDRRAAQTSLPLWIANAWTQPGDLGVSVHDFKRGACVYCLYLPEHPLENEDQIVASALGVGDLSLVRTLLYTGAGVPRSLLESIAATREIPLENLLPFEGHPIRSLYVEGFCGGAVIPLGGSGTPRQEVHVPLPHQSALAGILLAAACVQRAIYPRTAGTNVTRIDVMNRLGSFLTQPAAKDSRQICICQDADYQAVYALKYC